MLWEKSSCLQLHFEVALLPQCATSCSQVLPRKQPAAHPPITTH